MAKLTIINREGMEMSIDAPTSGSLMEIIRDNCGTELFALCGGCCSCGTCHVHVESGDLKALPEMGAGEEELLEASSNRTQVSRLSCQIPVTDAIDGLRVRIAPLD